MEQQQQKFQQHLDQIKPHLEAGLKLDHAIHTVSEQYKKLNTEQNQFQTTHLHPLEQQLAQQQLALSHAQAKQQQISQQLTQSEFLSVFDQEPQSTLQRMQDYLQQYQQLLQKILKA